MDAYYYFNYRTQLLPLFCSLLTWNPVSAAWMILEAFPLITSPTVISSILSPEVRETTRTAASPLLQTKYAD